ncbi:MAG TPA: cupredoxin domain-containing protein [Acidimicrobiales bacterium]|nr:cupredoxin domain-containing protein [Acidimicrobiales bacterium]
MRTFRRLLPAAVVGLGLVLTGCTGGHPEVERQIAAANVGTGAGFEPSTVTVNKDDNVTLAVGNTSTRVHGFSIEGYGIQREVEPNNGIQVKFKSTKPGTFKIWCQLHETHQVATLVVQ